MVGGVRRWASVVWLCASLCTCNMAAQSGESDPSGHLLSGSQSGLEPASATNPEPGETAAAATQGNALATGANAIAAGAGAPLDGNLYYETRYPWALVGRFDLSDANSPLFALAGTKIGVRFSGTSLSVNFVDYGIDAFDVVIDGNDYAAIANQFSTAVATPEPCKPATQVAAFDGNHYPGCLLLNKSTSSTVPTLYPIVTGLEAGEHTAWLIKRTEFMQGDAGNVRLYGFQVDEGSQLLPPPPYFRRRLEVVGDSSTTGFGAAEPNPCSYGERTSDAGRSLPAYLAQELNAEVVNVSSSGQGVYQSYYDVTADHNLPTLYREVVPPSAGAYDFSTDHVDAVILSAGGDDLWGAAGSGQFSNNNNAITTSPTANFIAAYVAWLTYIRAQRPDATIFCALSYAAYKNDIITLGSALQQAVASRNAAGDANVLYFTFFPADDPTRNPNRYASIFDAAPANDLSFGCSGHPQPKMSAFLAKLLAPVVAARMGWTETTQ